MIGLDCDVFTDFSMGRPDYVARVLALPQGSVSLPIVTIEEVLRGRLNRIRQSDNDKKPGRLIKSYELLTNTVNAIRSFEALPFTNAALRQFDVWHALKIRIGTLDLRIAAICVAHSVKLVTRNRRDFERLPGLNVEFWQ